MSRITHTEITITKNPMLKVPVVVPQWEAHILLALWGDDAQVTGTVVLDREIPETSDEFTRLANKYGPRDEDIPYVARVYGSFGPGLRGMEQEFKASLADSRVASVTEVVPEPVEIDRTLLKGFDGSKAPTAPVELDGDLKPVTIDLIGPDNIKNVDGEPVLARSNPVDELVAEKEVDTFAGMTIEGQDAGEFLKSDVSDLTGDAETDA